MSLRTTSHRKRRTVLVTLTILALCVGVAFAAFFGRAGVTGGGKSAKFAAAWAGVDAGATGALAPKVEAGSVSTSAPTVPAAGGPLALPTGLEFFPGESYTFTANVMVASGSTRSGYVSGIDLPGLPTGYTAKITAGCASLLPPYNMSTADLKPVTVEITATDAAAASGATWTLGAGAAVLLTPLPKGQSTVPGGVTCPAFVPAA